jgi:protein involved in polysaccharide export with SLBB domain
LFSHGIPARKLPESFRAPIRTGAPQLNFTNLTIRPQADYILGPDDVLEVTIHGLYPGVDARPLRSQVMANGDLNLPVAGPVHVGGMNLTQATDAITRAYADGIINDPRVNVWLVDKATTSVVVLGEVGQPGVYRLPKYENDVAHAIAAAGGLREDAGTEIEVHRRVSPQEVRRAALLEHLQAGEPCPIVSVQSPLIQEVQPMPAPDGAPQPPMPAGPQPIPPPGVGMPEQPEIVEPLATEVMSHTAAKIVRIPLLGFAPQPLNPEDVVLSAGDVVVVPSRKNEIFYVVGPLSPTNFTRFSIGVRERDIGAGFLLPADRDIDVVTAVAMAGYIDPINSPTTVTVHRTGPDGEPLLLRVDLIKARYDRRENLLVQAGDIIYLNPDLAWYGRRVWDKAVGDMLGNLFSISYRKLMGFGS